MEEKRKSIIKLLIKVALIFIIFELFINTLGSVLASFIYSSINYGKYIIYAVSEFVVCLLALIFIFIKRKWYIFKKSNISFKDSLKLCMPIVVISLILLLINLTNLYGSNFNINNFLSLIVYVILIGFFEEVFFRGIIENELLENYSSTKKEVITSIVISGIIFGAVHLTNLLAGQDFYSTIFQFIQTSAIGILFGTIYYKTRNIWSLIFLHSFYDFAVLLSQNNLILDCFYIENIPLSYMIFSFISSILLSLIYLVYSASLFKSSKKRLYYNIIYLLVGLFFINSISLNILNPDSDKYYVCPTYENITMKKIQTHYYTYDDYTYTLNDVVYHIYLKNNKVILSNNDTKTILKEDVNRVVLIDNYLLILQRNSASDTLYINDLNNIDEDFISFKMPFLTSIGYLYNVDTDKKYPLVKSYINDLFILDNKNIKQIKIK